MYVCLFIIKDTATIVAFKMTNGAFGCILVHCGAIISLLSFVYNRKHIESSIGFQFFPIFKELESFIASAYDAKTADASRASGSETNQQKCKQLLIYVTALLKMLSAQCSEDLVDDVALLRFIGVHIQIERCRYVGVS